MRLPDARVWAIASSMVFTASSASFGASWLWRALSSSMSCDFVMARISPFALIALLLVLAAQLRLEERAQVGRPGARARLGRVLLERFGFLRGVLLLDGELDRAALAVDVDDDPFHRVALLEVRAHVLDAVARDLGS